MKIKVLFVDDDRNILDGLRRMLHGMSKEWDMRFALSGAEALDMMKSEAADIIVADMRMPEMNGVALLLEVMMCYPGTIRMILSGHADSEMIMRSVSVAHQYMSKPCEPDTLKAVIRKAINLRRLLQNGSLKDVILKMGKLPSVPTLYQEMLTELQAPDASIHKVAQLISQDLAMTAKILQLANSAFFGRRRSISNAVDAVAYLGLDHIQHLFLAVHAFMQFETSDAGLFSIEQLWQHSVSIAALAKTIAEQSCSNKKIAEDAFTAGLLHDIGKLLLASRIPGKYSAIIKRAQETGIPLHEAEQQILSATHAEVGAYLLGLWGLPDAVVEAAACHHNGPVDPAADYSALASLTTAQARTKH